MEVLIKELEKVIFDLHGAKSRWIKSIPIKEIFQDQIVWEGVVEVFDLLDHPKAKLCYAWSYLANRSGNKNFVAVLHQGPVDSPVKAVRASIIAEYKK